MHAKAYSPNNRSFKIFFVHATLYIYMYVCVYDIYICYIYKKRKVI